MNALAQRRLTPVLGAICVLLAVALLGVLGGAGRGLSWNATPPGKSAAVTERAVQLTPPKPLASYAEIWQRPLFTADRKPMERVAGEVQGASLGDLELTGIIMTPALRMALLHDRTGDREVRVREGATLPDGRWTLSELAARSATFDSGGERKELVLKVSAPAALKPDGTPVSPGPPGPAPREIHPDAVPPPAPRSGVPNVPITRPRPDDAARNARVEALKAAVQKRRAEQAAHSAKEGVR
jgi:general secretion pathway protein N